MTPGRSQRQRRDLPRRRGSVALALVALALTSGCAGSSAGEADQPTTASWLPATAPYVEMSTAQSGWAVWPSRDAWLVLRTDDGWRHVRNATPVGVPTGGGFVLATTPRAAVVAVGPYDRLLSSPLLFETATPGRWRPDELPGAVSSSRGGVAVASGGATAVLRSGQVVAQAAGHWSTLTTSRRLSPRGALSLDSLTWLDRTAGILTGRTADAGPSAFLTLDGGRTWRSQPWSAGSVATVAPCGSGRSWLLPVLLSDHRTRFERTADGGRSWASVGSLRTTASLPAWGCHGDTVWAVTGTSHLFASRDGGMHWIDRGPAPAELTDLDPLGGGAGIAVSRDGDQDKLWRVDGDGAHFSEIRLPGWVRRLGAQQSAD
jgi:photosystem II stability/assembly factor-like uncharacterized protein